MNQQVREGLAHTDITRQNGVLFIKKRPPFQGESGTAGLPRAKTPDFAKPTSRLAFWRHLPQHEGRHSVATAAWANLSSRCAAIHASTSGLTLVPRRKCPNTRRGRGRPRHNVGRASSPVRFAKTAWKLAKLQRAWQLSPSSSLPNGNKTTAERETRSRPQPRSFSA